MDNTLDCRNSLLTGLTFNHWVAIWAKLDECRDRSKVSDWVHQINNWQQRLPLSDVQIYSRLTHCRHRHTTIWIRPPSRLTPSAYKPANGQRWTINPSLDICARNMSYTLWNIGSVDNLYQSYKCPVLILQELRSILILAAIFFRLLLEYAG